ncbi:hypothetical protein [Lactococcus taiwanensis]
MSPVLDYLGSSFEAPLLSPLRKIVLSAWLSAFLLTELSVKEMSV